MKTLLSFAKTFSLSTFLTTLSLMLPAAVAAQSETQVGPRPWTGVCVKDGVPTIQGLQCLFGNIFTIIIPMIGFAAFVMFVVGAFKFLISGGNTQKTDNAKKTITYAVLGIIIALSSFIILNLISQFTGISEILEFKLPNANPQTE